MDPKNFVTLRKIADEVCDDVSHEIRAAQAITDHIQNRGYVLLWEIENLHDDFLVNLDLWYRGNGEDEEWLEEEEFWDI